MRFEPRISLITLGVSDMKISRNFYEALGWTAMPASTPQVTFFQGRGIVLGLYGHDALADDAGLNKSPQPGYRGVALAYNTRSKEEVDVAFKHTITCGARSIKEPENVFWGGYSGYFADPDGHLWEIAYNPFAPLDKQGHMQMEAGTAEADGEMP